MIEGCKGCCASIILIPLLCCATLLCVVVFVATYAPDPPIGGNFRPSANEAQAFQKAIDQATAQARDQGWFAFTFTERQLSSWLALESEEFAGVQDRLVKFQDVQVGLDGGRFTFYAKIERYGVALPVQVVVKPGFNDQGQFTFGIDSASIGGLTMPDIVLEEVKTQIDNALAGPFEALPGEYFLYQASLSIENGNFVVQGGLNR